MSDRDFFDDPDSPPPPAYEFSQQEFDQKIAHAVESSQNDQQQQRPADGGEEEWETWDEAAFTAAEARLKSLELGGSSTSPRDVPSSSGSGKAPIQPSGYPPEASSSAKVPVAGTAPLRIVKKSAKEKERPSWYAEAQLDGPSVPRSVPQPSGSRPLPTPGGSRHNPLRRQSTLLEREPTPPPQFTEIGPDLDGPPYQAYESVESTNRGVVMTYVPQAGDSNPPSPLASPTVSSQPASFASYAPAFDERAESPNRRRSLPRPPSQGSIPPPRTPPVTVPAAQVEVRPPVPPPPRVNRSPAHSAPSGPSGFRPRYGNTRVTFDPKVAYTADPGFRTEYHPQPEDDEQLLPGKIDAAAFYKYAFHCSRQTGLRLMIALDASASVAAQYTSSRTARGAPPAPYVCFYSL